MRRAARAPRWPLWPAALALLNGAMAEMATGEGKTLAIALAAAPLAWPGLPLHVLTANDYLARRDAANLGPFYDFCGLDVGRVLASACTLEKGFREIAKNTKNLQSREKLGEIMARRLKDKNIDKIVFDRGVYPYHGRIKALAEAMRKGGLVF